MQNEEGKKMTVADIFRKMNNKAFVKLTHKEENDIKYIYSDITESSWQECFVEEYGWKRLGEWNVKTICSESDGEMTILHIHYEKEMEK